MSPQAFPAPATVTLLMEDIQPHLDQLLGYVRAVGEQLHLPPSIYDALDLTDEGNRVALVTYALRYAAECAQSAEDQLPLHWDPDDDDEFPDTDDLEPISRRTGPHGRPRAQEDVGGGQ